MPHATNQGIRIHYRVEGEGPALILQHGMTWSMEGWARHGYVDVLKPYYRLVLVDARGHGKSDKPHQASAYELSLHVGDIVAVLDALDLPSAHFWGYSMGGWIGFGLAKYAPERARRLILGGAHPYGRSLPERLDASDTKTMVKKMVRGHGMDFDTLSADKQAEFLDNDFLAIAAARNARPSLQEVLPTMAMPGFLYRGELDGSFADSQRCAKEIPHAMFISCPQLNHPETFYRSDIVLPRVMKFLQSDTQGPPAHYGHGRHKCSGSIEIARIPRRTLHSSRPRARGRSLAAAHRGVIRHVTGKCRSFPVKSERTWYGS